MIPSSKPRVALEALKGVKSIQEIAKEFSLHPGQVSNWKKVMCEGAAAIFGPGRARSSAEEFAKERSGLHAKIGELTISVDFLQKSPSSSDCERTNRTDRQKSS